MSLDDMSDVFRILTNKKWAKTVLRKVPVKEATLNHLHYENKVVSEEEGIKFEAWLVPQTTTFTPGPTGSINSKENRIIRIDTKKYPFALDFGIGDIFLDTKSRKRWRITTHNDVSEYTNLTHLNATEDI